MHELLLHSLLGEEWKPVEGLESKYLISSYGRVWSLARKKLRKICKNEKGYHYFGIDNGLKRVNYWIHIEVCKAFNGPKPFDGAMVLHKDDRKPNNRADNLYWGNATQNELDAFNNGCYDRKAREANNG
jgi:hypothetical protein